MELNFTLDTEKRIQLYELEEQWFTHFASEATDENSRNYYLTKAEDRRRRVQELRGA